jgi:hypothetical protein
MIAETTYEKIGPARAAARATAGRECVLPGLGAALNERDALQRGEAGARSIR